VQFVLKLGRPLEFPGVVGTLLERSEEREKGRMCGEGRQIFCNDVVVYDSLPTVITRCIAGIRFVTAGVLVAFIPIRVVVMSQTFLVGTTVPRFGIERRRDTASGRNRPSTCAIDARHENR
jgi:hypothetical protein